MRFVLSRHAEEEVARRGIPRTLVDLVLTSPQQIVPEQGGRVAYQSQLDFGNGQIVLPRAIVVATVEPAIVVTVCRTSKISKYWRPTA